MLFFLDETFDPKKFFELVGLRAMSPESVKDVFRVLDVDGSGFIEEDELKWDPCRQTCSTRNKLSPTHSRFAYVVDRYVLKGFSKEGRDLTDDETKAFLKAADKDGDGKIGIDGERGAQLCWINTTTTLSMCNCVLSFAEFEIMVHE